MQCAAVFCRLPRRHSGLLRAAGDLDIRQGEQPGRDYLRYAHTPASWAGDGVPMKYMHQAAVDDAADHGRRLLIGRPDQALQAQQQGVSTAAGVRNAQPREGECFD